MSHEYKWRFLTHRANISVPLITRSILDMTQVTDKTQVFLPEAVRKRPQDSAGHHAVVHPISPSACRDGGLPSGGHLFPPAGHLLELHQSNVSRH